MTVGGYYIYPHPQGFNVGGPVLGLPGLAYNFKWTPVFFNQSQKALSGASIDIGLAATPLHNFELTYSVLRNVGAHPYNQAGYDPIKWEMRRLMGFFNYQRGTAGRFAFDNPDDDTLTGQKIGTTTGALIGDSWQIVRSFGDSHENPYPSEPVGLVDPTTVVLYFGGTLISAADYTVSNVAGNVVITMTANVAISGNVTVDALFYYYCKFAEDISVYEKFTDIHWSNASVKLQSCRAGA